MRSALRLFSDDKGEAKQAAAATKIQRKWRRWKGYDTYPALTESALDYNGAENPSVSGESTRSEPGRIQRRNESQVGSAMRELTGQRVAIGIIMAMVVSAVLTYQEANTTRPTTMMVLHTQTKHPNFVDKSLAAARGSTIPDLYSYTLADGSVKEFSLDDVDTDDLLPRERMRITVEDAFGNETIGYFSYRDEIREEACVSILSTIFVLLVWFFGVTSFAGPVMILVVIPIERMVRLLGMLMLDPLGYQSSPRYRRFVAEEDEIAKNSNWSKEVLKGMETSFLMSTILRIGSLMKVGFGSAGVEIIRNNLQKGQTKNQLMLSEKGSEVSCIFLFSDIRQFTDATECLQEEVFVFTNRIAAVVHSICHSYGGAANKNIGDAFLLSWLLDKAPEHSGTEEKFTARYHQADKALLSVVKICMALHHDDYYVKTMSEVAREALLSKLSKRKGPIVQMGFGLHAGTAVQGAIGSIRKIDATYVSEAVERAEYLESSTKKYGLQVLMSGSFHKLLHPSNRRRCRKIDQILIRNDDNEEERDEHDGELVELLTFDMDIDALWREEIRPQRKTGDSDSEFGSEKLGGLLSMRSAGRRRQSLRNEKGDELSDGNFILGGDNTDNDGGDPPTLVLPTGPETYKSSVWIDSDMHKMRERYTDGLFFTNFNAGLQAYYSKDWDSAKKCFTTILDRFEDGPSRYFLGLIEKNKGKPPRNFMPFAVE